MYIGQEIQNLVEQFKENEKEISKAKKTTLLIEVLMVGVVVGMKVKQASTTFELNVIATVFVSLLLCWHFWKFYPRRALQEKSTKIVLEGLELEKQQPSSGVTFF